MNNKIHIVAFIFTIVFASSCTQMSKLQTARTAGANNLKFGGLLSVYVFQEDGAITESAIPLPFAMTYAYYGVSEKVDVGLALSSAMNVQPSVKALVIGNNSSPFALAAEVGLELQGNFNATIDGSIMRSHTGLISSYYFKNNNAIFFEPKIIGQYTDETEFFLGGSFGYEINKPNGNKWTIGATYNKFVGDLMTESSSNLFQLGVSYAHLFELSK